MKRSIRFQRPGLLGGSTANTLLDADGPQPSLNLDLASGILDPRIDFQRTTVGTYYRGQFNQNLFTQSQDLTNAAYGALGATVANITDTAPDGSTTVTRMTESATNERHLIGRSAYVPLAANLTHTLSVFVKKVSRRYIQLIGLSSSINSFSAIFDLDNGVITDTRAQGGNYISGSITPVGNGWYRCSITGNTTVAQTTLSVVHSNVATFALATLAFGSPSYLGDGTSQTLVWGYQLTEGSLLTPYIPTTTAAITQGQIASSQPWNLFLRSQEFDVSPWASAVTGAGVSPVITANAAVAPDGTTTADQIDFNCGGLTLSDRCIRRQATSLSATTYTVSVWARSATGTTQHIQFHQDGGTSATTFAIGTSWQRITLTYTSVGGSVQTGLELRGNNTAGVTTSSIYVWGMQLNEGPAALDYRSTVASALWLPRFENDPVTGEARGLLIEGGITNLCIRSEEFNTWAKVAAGDIVTANAGTSPDGLVTADKIIADTTSGAHGVVRSVTTTGSTTYTQSVFVKAAGWNWVYMTEGNTLTATAWFNLANGTVGTVSGTGTPSADIQPIGNDWYRCTLTFTTNAGQVNANIQVRPTTGNNVYTGYVGNGVDGVLAWGAQMEAQSFASSYIPTVAATVARGLDSAVMTGTNFSSWYNQSEGTLLTDLRVNNLIAVRQGANINSTVGGSNQNFVATGTSASDVFVATRIAATVYGDFLATTSLGPHKLASAYTQAVQAGAANGTAFADTSTPAFVVTLNQMHIGDNPVASAPLNGHIRRIAYWPTRLPNATLQSLTT